ncbi:tRNA dihydrouridine synthase DusB [Desulfurivibrio alkaliphilus]|uniref:tRNA-dihydrouridine synthase n=1 Tax=Desulfurivibrio alkaliphilus (strain DSM 19089 / UNIQEM U267 / AHT2) TaxID=589865 RepID=D6Z018_DESAT|nr:tRNA dihydrouridine synthase DusB [Desulfurivibrio alkaliphilus]ADH85175.1 TIM-barrel protein, nifR3 family [Desulfurivibrio alkaliphilus AHT 2]
MNEQTLQIGPIAPASPLIAAPLAGFSDLAFRLLCREYGAGLCYSEMISCHGLVRQQPSTLELLATVPAERPVIMQLFGAEPEVMGQAAAILSRLPIDGIDINMGCPVKKVVKKGAGAALMRQPELAAAIVTAVVKATELPVTVKIRTGWNHQRITAPEFARRCEDCGAAAITVHGRTWSDGFSGRADQRLIAAVKQAVKVPVIGNGDVTCHQEAVAMMANTGCDGVMIGRGAIGAPWVFSPDFPTSPTLPRRLAAARRHLELLQQYHPHHHPSRINNQIGRYFKGVPGGAAIRKEIYEAVNPAALAGLLQRLG